MGLQKSRSIKSKLLAKFINTKVPILAKETRIECKNYINLAFNLMEKSKQAYQSKQAYHNKYFKQIGIILITHGKEPNP